MKNRMKEPRLTAEFCARDAEHRRLLGERIAYHERKLEKERASDQRQGPSVSD
jgi:hypothetical protein